MLALPRRQTMLRATRTPVSALAVRAAHAARRGRGRADCISISNLQLECIVGIFAHERARPQPLRIDIEMEVDVRAAARTESCATTIDYVAVAEQVRGPPCEARGSRSEPPRRILTPLLLAQQTRFVMEAGRFQLLETAAQAITLTLALALALTLTLTPTPTLTLTLTLTLTRAGDRAAAPHGTRARRGAWRRAERARDLGQA